MQLEEFQYHWRHWTEGSAFRFTATATDISLFQRVQTGSAAHLPFCKMDTSFYSGIKQPTRETDHPFPYSFEVMNARSYSSTPLYAFMVCVWTLHFGQFVNSSVNVSQLVVLSKYGKFTLRKSECNSRYIFYSNFVRFLPDKISCCCSFMTKQTQPVLNLFLSANTTSLKQSKTSYSATVFSLQFVAMY